jgi:hypothetical protein
MLYNEFIQRYANTPLDKRLAFTGANKPTIDTYYDRIRKQQNIIDEAKKYQDELLKEVEPLLK